MEGAKVFFEETMSRLKFVVIFAIFAVGTWLIGLQRSRSEPKPGDEDPANCVGQLSFAAKTIIECEGYWRNKMSDHEVDHNHYDQTFPFPVVHPLPFCGQKEWLRRLYALQSWAVKHEDDTGIFGVRVVRVRGLATSRITGELLGNKEYVDDNECSAQSNKHTTIDVADSCAKPVCWTGDFGEHYVEGFNAVPSEEFYTYVIMKYEKYRAMNH